MHEGQRVTYIGPEAEGGLLPGETGKLLMMASSNSAHVQMGNGAVYLVMTDDLVEARKQAVRDPLDDSLEVGSISVFAARQVYDIEGAEGVVNQMADYGHLASFSEIAEEAISMVASRIRQDVSFREVLSSLDEEEGEAVLRVASAALIRDAFGDHEGE